MLRGWHFTDLDLLAVKGRKVLSAASGKGLLLWEV